MSLNMYRPTSSKGLAPSKFPPPSTFILSRTRIAHTILDSADGYWSTVAFGRSTGASTVFPDAFRQAMSPVSTREEAPTHLSSDEFGTAPNLSAERMASLGVGGGAGGGGRVVDYDKLRLAQIRCVCYVVCVFV